MRLPFLALAAVSLVPFQVGCDFESIADASDHYREDFQYTYNLKPGGRLSVDNYNGSVEILGWEKDSVQITGTKYAGREQLLKDIKIETKADDNSVTIHTVRPSWHGNSGAKYSIRVPFKVELDRIVSSNGQIRVEDVQGNSSLETSNGAVRLRKVEGRLDAKTSNGAIEADGLTGDATLRTSNGSIRLDRMFGALDARTSNGGVHIRLGKPKAGEPVKLGSSNGSIELEVEELDNNEIHASTSNATITLRLPPPIKARLRASTSNGGISTEFDVTTHGAMGKNFLEGEINGGGPLIDLSTSNGTIKVQKM
ncbi:MAG TPA: DUF4097 family beta strand repeat-containing protein [Bryobacteraceae bacterium]|nr:DUF4097 family beta strand repeat-containing protein [Bryobacteraceae bacterium]